MQRLVEKKETQGDKEEALKAIGLRAVKVGTSILARV